MKVRVNTLPSACATALLLFGMPVALATERVTKGQQSKAFDVYTVAEIDGIKKDLASHLQALNDFVIELNHKKDQEIEGMSFENRLRDQNVQAAEARMKDEVKASIDNLPQRLLSEEAKKALKDAVVVELKEENAQLRRDIQSLQDKYDALQKDVEGLKKAIQPR